jgi:hypothetical protein
MRQETAVEWLADQIQEQLNVFLPGAVLDDMMLIKAKQMEIKQSHEYAEFAIRCDRKHMKILNFDGYMNLETSKSE